MTTPLGIVHTADLDALEKEVEESVRKRHHINIHKSYREPCQRLINVIHPQSYIRPHKHEHISGDETLVVLQGEGILVIFDDEGSVLTWFRMSVDHGARVVVIPPGVWHTVLAVSECPLMLFEVKEGPFEPNRAKQFAPWAPPENEDTKAYMDDLIRGLDDIP